MAKIYERLKNTEPETIFWYTHSPNERAGPSEHIKLFCNMQNEAQPKSNSMKEKDTFLKNKEEPSLTSFLNSYAQKSNRFQLPI
jgi:hypothetical protein